jgi:hypothetical protein
MRHSKCSCLIVAFGFLAGCGSNGPLEADPATPDSPDAGGSGATPSATLPPETSTTSCAGLVVEDPAVSLDGIAMFLPDQKRNNPEAGEPWYVYLEAGREGVVVGGPSVPSADGRFALQSPAIAMRGDRGTAAEGYTVTVNSAVAYDVAIDDFEFEVALARVELCEQEGNIQSRFLFRGNRGASGVAHDITITASVNGMKSAVSEPVTVEVR